MSKNKQRGTAFETLVVQACKNYYPQAHRNPLAGSKDVGDVWLGDPRLVLECKHTAKLDLPGFIREAQAEAKNLNDHAVGVVVTKRHGSADPMKQWAHMELGDLLKLINDLSEPSPLAFK